jgi:hypothetical protein
MALSAKAKSCLQTVVALKEDETTEVLDRFGAVKAGNPALSDDVALAQAVRSLIADLRRGAQAPAQGTAMSDMTAELTSVPTKRKEAATEIARKAADDFLTRVDAAKAAGEITVNDEERLLNLALGGERGRVKAKDELMRLREEAAERKVSEADAGKLWNDPDWMYQEGDPKFEDLSVTSKAKWTKAAKGEKTSIDLYDELVGEHRAVSSVPQVNDPTDPLLNAEFTTANPDNRLTARIDATAPEMQQGHTAAMWLAVNSKDPWIRRVAAKIAPYIPGDVSILHLEVGQKYSLPADVAKLIRNGAGAVAAAYPDGAQKIFMKSDYAFEETLLHELIHVGTQYALLGTKNAMLRAELESIAGGVRKALNDVVGSTEAKFFAQVIDSADELLAYAFTSPTLRKWLGGRSVVETAGATELVDTAPRSLWQRFVDWVLKVFGMDKAFEPKMADALNASNDTVFIVEGLDPNLYARLDALLDQALEAQLTSPRTTPIMAPSTQAVPKGQMGSDIPNVLPGLNLPDFEPGNPFATRMKDWAGGWRNKPGMLGWLTLRQIADRFKDVPGVTEFAELSSRMGAKAKSLMAESHSVDQEWAKLKNDEAIELQKMMLESTMEQMWPDRPLSAAANHMLDRTNPATVAKHAALARRYQAMGETQKRVYQQAQAKMRKDWDERGKLMRARVIDQYRPELDAKFPGEALDTLASTAKAERESKLASLSRNEKKSVASMWDDLDTHAERLSQMQGPYFPLVRFGQHVVVAKSGSYETAADEFAAARDELEGLNEDEDSTPERLTRARAEVKDKQRALEALKDSEKHYVVEFYESPTEARAREKQLRDFFASKGTPMSVYAERRQDHFAKMDSVSPAFMKKLEAALSSNLPDKDATAIRAAVRDLYIQSMPERSALKSQLRRLSVKGVKAGEMRRAFAAASMRGAWHLSRLEFGTAMQSKLVELRTGDSDDQRVVGGELARRLVAAFQQDEGSLLVDRLSNLSYLTYLGLSPSFFIMNAAQPWVISLPIIASRFGVKRAASELGRAFNDTAAAMKASATDQKTWRFELNLEEFKDEDERSMLSALFNKGIIDVTIEHDLGSLASGQETTVFGKVMSLATLPAHHTEVVNRVMTALAAYRLARTPGMTGKVASTAEATSYAESVVADTHLDYTPENAPRFMRTASLGGMGRIVFQFKKYMQGMIYLLGKLAVDAARGDKEAGKGLVYLMGSQLAVAGTSGLPMAAPLGLMLAAVAKMWPDDDEPEIEQLFWNGVEDTVGKKTAQLLRKGLPAAVLNTDVSGRIGMGNILNPLAFADGNKEGKDWVASAALTLLGPSASMVANWAEALSVAKDDPVKALQLAAPKVIGDPIRAMDRYNRGVTTRAGNELISPDEFGPLGIAMRAIGFESTEVTDMYDKRSAFMDAKTRRDEVRQRLIKQASQGADASEAIDSFNDRHPDNKITAQTLRSAAQQRASNRDSQIGGVTVKKQDRELARRLGVE